MKLRYILSIFALGGVAYYYDLLPWKRTPAPVAITKADPSLVRSLQASIRANERAIAELEDQSRRGQRAAMGDQHSQNIRNKRIAELQRENAGYAARIAAAGGQ